MHKFLLGSAALAAIAAAAAAVAQPVPPAPPIHGQLTGDHAMPGAMHRGAMKAPTRAEVLDRMRMIFTRLDANRDGYLTKTEAVAGRALIKGQRQQRSDAVRPGQRRRVVMDRGAMFDRLDINGDGVISRGEFANAPARQQRRVVIGTDRNGDGRPDRAMRRQGGMRVAGMRLGGRMFEQADINRDSRVSLNEATGAALRHFDMVDANRDGTLAPDERRQMRERMKEMHRVTRTSLPLSLDPDGARGPAGNCRA